MKRTILFIMAVLLFVGVNVYAAGDLIVNGNLGVGTSNPLYKMHIVSTDQSTALRLEPTLTNLTVLSNYAGLYRIVADNQGFTGGSFIGFSGNVSMNGGGTITSLQGAENNIVLNSSTTSTIDISSGNKVELRRASGNTTNHNLTNYYGFWSFGNAQNGSGAIEGNDWRHAYFEDFPAFGGTVANVSGLWVDRQTRGFNNYGIVLNGDGAGADIVFGASQESRIYSSGGRLYAEDSAGNQTIISPHDPETGEWIYYSKNTTTGVTKRINMERLVKAVEKLTGEKFIVETIIEE